MRIVIIDKYDSQKISGTIMFTKRLVEYLTSHGHWVHVLRYTNESKTPPYISPIPFHLEEPRSYIIIPSEKTPSLIKHHLQTMHPDIVYAYCGVSPFDFILPSLCHSLQIPIAHVWHQDFNYSISAVQLLFKTLFWAYVPVCESSDLIHVFSQKLKKFYIRRGISSGKILALPNGVDPTLYTPGISRFKAKHQIEIGILFIGRLSLQKNPEVLFQSFLGLNPPLSTKLVVVGRGDLGGKLKKKYRDPRIIFTGLITDELKKIDVIRSCSIFVQPSLSEGMSLALLEAMATGLSCITSDAGNNKELLKNAGTIIPLNTIASELPKVLDAYIKNKEKTKEKGMQARKTILKSYSEVVIYTNLVRSLELTVKSFNKKMNSED